MSKNKDYNAFALCRKLPPTKKVTVNGEVIVLYSLGWLSFLSNRHTASLRLLERDKVLPRPLLETGTGLRFYTAEELLGYARILRSITYGPGNSLVKQGVPFKMSELRRNLLAKIQGKSKMLHIIPDHDKLLDILKKQTESKKTWKNDLGKLITKAKNENEEAGRKNFNVKAAGDHQARSSGEAVAELPKRGLQLRGGNPVRRQSDSDSEGDSEG